MPDAHASAFERKPAGRDGLPCGEPLPRWNQRCNKKSEKRGCQKSVPVTVVSNIRPQGCRGAPQARPSRPAVFIRSQEPARRVPSCRWRLETVSS